MQELGFFIRIVVAGLCGSFIGLERTRRFKEAGIRTHILVACASALMMIVSKYGFADLQFGDNFFAGIDGADASRIASQVVTGISFLGAGVIFKHGASVRGLTTAAGIWATSGIGLAIGAGMYLEGIFVTILVIFSQLIMHKLTLGRDSVETISVNATVKDPDLFRTSFEEKMSEKGAKITYVSIAKSPNQTTSYKITLVLSRKHNLSDIVLDTEGDQNIVMFSASPAGVN
ncbi:MAG: MgtC/SapB family protein [Oscillospiraceae bacterium]|nr:MgtC/SapB family protein [Oscillospiraceae bacterium]